MNKLKNILSVFSKAFVIFLKKHHFVFLLIVFFITVLFIGWIYWQNAYLALNDPVSLGADSITIQRGNAERLEAIFKERSAFYASTSVRQWANLLR